MTRKCALTGKSVMFGNNVSHAHNKTRKKFLPNLQNISFMSDILRKPIRLRVSTSGLKTVESKGGIDSYLLSACDCHLSPKAKIFKNQLIEAKLAAKKQQEGR